MDPADKVALVTGGASGIGLAICKELLQNKVKGVAICDIGSEMGQQRLQELKEEYGQGRVIFIECDVRSYQQLEEAFQKTIETFGTLDIVVNNAGIFDDFQWEKEVDINLNGVIRGLLLAFQYMGKNNNNRGGVVVNIASILGLDAFELVPIYSGTKHGVVGLTKAFGKPLHFDRTGVRVVAMCPGYTTTNIRGGEERFLVADWAALNVGQVFQPPECVSREVLQMIREAPNGSVWVAEEEKPSYQVIIPSRQSLRDE